MNHPGSESDEAEQVVEEALGTHLPLSRAGLPERLLGVVVAVTLFAIMALTFVNVFLRYVFVSPITGSEEMVSFGMAILIFTALPLVTYHERHITVGLLQGKLSSRATWLQRLFILAVSIVAVFVMGWRLAAHGMDLAEDATTTTVLGWPLAPLSFFMSALSGVTLITLLVLLLRHLRLFNVAGFGGRT